MYQVWPRKNWFVQGSMADAYLGRWSKFVLAWGMIGHHVMLANGYRLVLMLHDEVVYQR